MKFLHRHGRIIFYNSFWVPNLFISVILKTDSYMMYGIITRSFQSKGRFIGAKTTTTQNANLIFVNAHIHPTSTFIFFNVF